MGRKLKWVSRTSLAFGALAMIAPIAHVLELPNKLLLDGDLWLAVQQRLYRGWGPFLGAPTEIGAFAVSLLLAFLQRRGGGIVAPFLVACGCYAGMLLTFFVLNAPVNAATASWTVATLPQDWTSYRAQWEAGHAVAATLSLVGFAALLTGRRGRRRQL